MRRKKSFKNCRRRDGRISSIRGNKYNHKEMDLGFCYFSKGRIRVPGMRDSLVLMLLIQLAFNTTLPLSKYMKGNGNSGRKAERGLFIIVMANGYLEIG